ncbi:hypothetical protein ACB098_02G087600 [Castanea mollissima]
METKKLIILTKPSSLEMLLTLCFYLCILLKWNLYFIITNKREHLNNKHKQNKTRKMGFRHLVPKLTGALKIFPLGPIFVAHRRPCGHSSSLKYRHPIGQLGL